MTKTDKNRSRRQQKRKQKLKQSYMKSTENTLKKLKPGMKEKFNKHKNIKLNMVSLTLINFFFH